MLSTFTLSNIKKKNAECNKRQKDKLKSSGLQQLSFWYWLVKKLRRFVLNKAYTNLHMKNTIFNTS